MGNKCYSRIKSTQSNKDHLNVLTENHTNNSLEDSKIINNINSNVKKKAFCIK